MSSVSRPVSGQTPMRGMIEEQSAQSASVKGSVSSSDSVIDASIMSSVPSVKDGSESPGMSELADRLLEYQPPPDLTAEMGEAVDEVIKYMKTTAELLSVLRIFRKIRKMFFLKDSAPRQSERRILLLGFSVFLLLSFRLIRMSFFSTLAS